MPFFRNPSTVLSGWTFEFAGGKFKTLPYMLAVFCGDRLRSIFSCYPVGGSLKLPYAIHPQTIDRPARLDF